MNTAPLKQRITVVKVPKPFPIEEIGEMNEEACSKKAAELANEKREEIEQALRNGHDDQAWSLVSTVAESYLEWRCSSSISDRRKGGKGRCGEPKTKECFLAASVGERSCDIPATKLTRKLQKSRRQAVEIQTKLSSRKACKLFNYGTGSRKPSRKTEFRVNHCASVCFQQNVMSSGSSMRLKR